jgi:hypothetical protein
VKNGPSFKRLNRPEHTLHLPQFLILDIPIDVGTDSDGSRPESSGIVRNEWPTSPEYALIPQGHIISRQLPVGAQGVLAVKAVLFFGFLELIEALSFSIRTIAGTLCC